MEAWIPITIAGAFFQNLRSAVQRHLKGRLSTLGAAYVRFFYAWPFALLYLFGLHEIGGLAWPEPNLTFLAYSLAGGLSQILFTVTLIWLFSFRNFAVGTTFSKTETVQVAVLSFLFLGDGLSWAAAIAIAISMVGVMVLSLGQSKLSIRALGSGLRERSTLVGLLCGAFLGASVVFFRGAALSLGYDGVVMAAAFSLTVAVVLQTVLMGLYLAIREPRTLVAVVVEWRWSLLVGLAGVGASIAWFTAFTMQNAAYVRALGQVELIFGFLVTGLVFRERITGREGLGIALLGLSVVILVLHL